MQSRCNGCRALLRTCWIWPEIRQMTNNKRLSIRGRRATVSTDFTQREAGGSDAVWPAIVHMQLKTSRL